MLSLFFPKMSLFFSCCYDQDTFSQLGLNPLIQSPKSSDYYSTRNAYILFWNSSSFLTASSRSCLILSHWNEKEKETLNSHNKISLWPGEEQEQTYTPHQYFSSRPPWTQHLLGIGETLAAIECTPLLRAEDLGSVPSTHALQTTSDEPQFRGPGGLFWPPRVLY